LEGQGRRKNPEATSWWTSLIGAGREEQGQALYKTRRRKKVNTIARTSKIQLIRVF